jgi:hypothetical protein
MDGEGKFWLGVVFAGCAALVALIGAMTWGEHENGMTRRACLEHHSALECSVAR